MIRCFVRPERNGMWVVFPIEGRMRHDCMVVNGTVKFVYDLLLQSLPIASLADTFVVHAREGKRASAATGDSNGGPVADDPEAEDERTRFDLYRILLSLKDREICDYSFEEIASLLPAGRVVPGTTQVMPLCLLGKTSAFLREAVAIPAVPAGEPVPSTNGNAAPPWDDRGRPVRVFYSFPTPDRFGLDAGAYFATEPMLRRHLDQAEVYFVALDGAGEVEACTAVRGLPYQPLSLVIFLVAVRSTSDEDLEDKVGIHLARLCGLLQVTSLSAKIRLQHTPGLAYFHPCFDRVIGELGFRRAFRLPDEVGPGKELVAFDRALF
jgi:hypothetical protein